MVAAKPQKAMSIACAMGLVRDPRLVPQLRLAVRRESAATDSREHHERAEVDEHSAWSLHISVLLVLIIACPNVCEERERENVEAKRAGEGAQVGPRKRTNTNQ